MARTGLDLMKSLSVGGFVKYHPKDDSSVFYKAEIVSLDGELAKIIAKEGPRYEDKATKEKAFNCHMDRLKGVQGRQKGFSPVKKSAGDEDEDDGDKPAPKKPSKEKEVAKPAKDKGKATAKESDDSPVEYDLESAKKELADKIEEIDTAIETIEDALEILDNNKASLEAIGKFLDSLKMGDTAEEDSPSPEEKKTRTRRTRKTSDEDEA